MADLPARRGGGMLGAPRGWDPFERMQELLGFDLGRMLGPQGTREGGFVPDFEVKETQDAFIFKADVPGVEEKDLEITLAENRLTISGKREEERRDESDRYYAYERNYGSFSRTFTLPGGECRRRPGGLQEWRPQRAHPQEVRGAAQAHQGRR